MQFANLLQNAPCISDDQNCFAVSYWWLVPDLTRHSHLNIQIFNWVYFTNLLLGMHSNFITLLKNIVKDDGLFLN